MSGIVWTGNDGYLSANNLSKTLRYVVKPECKFRQFAKIKNAVGKHKGQDFHWDVFSRVVTKGTTLVETNTMPETTFNITQGTLTVEEYGNSVPYAGKLEDLSELSMKEVINEVMSIDAKEAFDTATEIRFNQTQLRVVPTAGTATDTVVLTTNGTATATNNVALGKEHIKVIVDTMKDRNIPPYMGNDYACLARHTTLRNLKNELEAVHQYVDEGFRLILAGEIGRYEGVRFFEQTNIASAGWSNSKSDWAYFFGKDTVAEGVACPEEIRAKLVSDYGRSKGLAWYYLGGFALQRLTAEDARIVKWDSAA